jgi:hypothetical protein
MLFIGRPRLRRSLRPFDASPTIRPRVPRHRSFSTCLDPVSAHRAFCLGFVAQPSNPACRLRSWATTLLWLLSTTSSCFSCHHAAHTRSCLATGPIDPSLLVFSLLGGPARLRPFAPSLHLHQRKSSRNLHLQYSAKSLSTPCCQSLIT